MPATHAIPFGQPIEYPTSDGKPMAETTLHREVMSDLIEGLAAYYLEAPDVWVGGNLFLCYEEGNPRAALAPDVLFARGVPKYRRDNYLLWQERPPALIVEVTSRSTRGEDLNKKKDIYQRIGVEEYILFDPYGDYLRPRLRGFRLTGRGYEPAPMEADGSLLSLAARLLFRPEGEKLRLVEPDTGRALPWIVEEAAARRDAERQAAVESAARHAAEERARTLEDEVARLRSELERRR